ncbi:MAG: type I-C CRISPR-associated protein Cas8c/Csd1 [Christensenellales bacterium]|jgi:CRISPR-associated protein Csd1
MILQALNQLYDYLASRDLVEQPGWTRSKISYGLDLGDDGDIALVYTLKESNGKGKPIPRILKTPIAPKRTVGIEPVFLFDNPTYLLGVDAKAKPERTRNCFEACKALHLDVLSDVDTPAARAIKAYFANWNPDAAREHPVLKDYLDDMLTGVNLIFYYHNRPVTEDDEICRAWQRHYDSGEGEKVRCLVTGEMARAARIHPAIKGVRGGQPVGTALVSFNAPAFESFGREQGMNAPVGEHAAFAYTTALNYLIADRDHQQMIGDTLVVMWSESGERVYPDFGMAALDMSEDAELIGEEAQRAISGAIKKLARGEIADWEGIRIDPSVEYYIFGFSPNAARLSVRFFLQNSFGHFMRNAQRHRNDMEIVRPSFDRFEHLSLWRMLQETVNMNSRDKSPQKQMAGDTLRAILTNTRYPATLINAVELRIRAERNVTRGRAAIIKAYYLKNKGLPTEVLQVELNRDSTYMPYVLGRLFSVLEQVQENANGTATIQDRYFNSASATPAHIFPILMDLAKKHLAKLETRSRIYFEQQINDFYNRFDKTLPTRMTLAERGAFQIGYYHQQQDRYTKKNNKEGQDK